MSSIHRVHVVVEDYQEIDLTGPPISVAASREGLSTAFDLWFEHDGLEPRKCAIYIFGTGHPTPWTHSTRYAWGFLGTVVTSSGLVWHVYTGPKKKDLIPA